AKTNPSMRTRPATAFPTMAFWIMWTSPAHPVACVVIVTLNSLPWILDFAVYPWAARHLIDSRPAWCPLDDVGPTRRFPGEDLMLVLRPVVCTLLFVSLLAGCSLYGYKYRLWEKANASDA